MYGEDWIRSELQSLACVRCGRAYASSDIQVLAQRDELYFIDLSCPECGSRAVAVVTLDGAADDRADGGDAPVRSVTARTRDRVAPPERQPICTDDVIDVHRFLDTFDGDFRRLFERTLGGPPRRGGRT